MRHYLIVSDLHLADIETHHDGWKRYKNGDRTFDREFSAQLHRFAENHNQSDRRTLILNGDTIDFDLVSATPAEPPWPVSRAERRRGLVASEEKSIWKLERVLADHPGFVEALARFLAQGHRIVIVVGNHDPELNFPGVRQRLSDALVRIAEKNSWSLDLTQLIFEPWFYYIPGEIFAEHGQQYDSYSSFRYVLSPIVSSLNPPVAALSMGNISNRFLMSRIGFFNPHASDYILNVFRYIGHWLRFYAFSRRSLLRPWLFGSLAALRYLFSLKREIQRCPPNLRALLESQAERAGLSNEQVDALHNLRRGPITNRVYRVVRELWIDRVILALAMTGTTIALSLLSLPLWVKWMVPLSSFPLFFLIYEWFAHGETIFASEHQMIKAARAISETVAARVITMGHTHKPGIIPLSAGVSYVNTGTWAPVTKQGDRERLAPGLRNILHISFPDPSDSRQAPYRLELTCDQSVSKSASTR